MASTAEAQLRKPRVKPAHQVERFYELSLLGLLASGFLALAGSEYLDIPVLALTTAGILLRVLMVAGVLRVALPDGLVTAAALGYVGFYPVDWLFLSKDFMQATVHLVCFLAVTKLLTARSNRDYFYLKVIAFLELLAASILSSNVNFFFFLALFLGFGVASFACSEIRRSSMRPAQVVRGGLRLFHWRLTALTLWMAAGILVMTGGMFFLLPRTARAAFQHLSHRYHLTGFSNEVTLGQIGEIQRQSTTVMHVRFDAGGPSPNLKWRGAALGEFDGRRWFNRPGSSEVLPVDQGMLTLARNEQLARSGPRLYYVVYANRAATDALFIAGIPEYLYTSAPVVIRSAGGTLRGGFGASDTKRYRVRAASGDALEPLLAADRATYLRLPQTDARIQRLAQEVTAGERTETGRARAIESHLRTKFGYTTDLLDQPVGDPLAHFLFERRKGHCEYFASSMAVMLRTLGIPSRMITGFQSGIFNPISGWQLIRASDAHSWVEAYLPDRGWTIFDPTPPSRAQGVSIWMHAMLYVDAAEVFWQDWVLNYDQDRQFILANRMEESRRALSVERFEALRLIWVGWKSQISRVTREHGWAAAGFIIAPALLLMLGKPVLHWLRARQRVQKVRRGDVVAGDGTLLYMRMLSILRRRGIEKPAWLTPFEFARVLSGETAVLVEELTMAYHDLRFGGKRDAAGRMIQLLERLEKQPA